MHNKIFCIGFNKTGTSSMHELFQSLGLKSFHDVYSDAPLHHEVFQQYQCFSDGDMHPFQELDTHFKNSKFILTTRRLDDWLVSRIRHVEYRRSIGRTGAMRKEYESNPALAVENWVQRRTTYHNNVLTYFSGRKNDFRVVNICDCADTHALLTDIVEFIGMKPLPGTHFPEKNISDKNTAALKSTVRSKHEVYAEVMAVLTRMGLAHTAGSTDT